jgi:hypothetical protein
MLVQALVHSVISGVVAAVLGYVCEMLFSSVLASKGQGMPGVCLEYATQHSHELVAMSLLTYFCIGFVLHIIISYFYRNHMFTFNPRAKEQQPQPQPQLQAVYPTQMVAGN